MRMAELFAQYVPPTGSRSPPGGGERNPDLAKMPIRQILYPGIKENTAGNSTYLHYKSDSY